MLDKPHTLCVHCHLDSFVYAKSIYIQACYRLATEVLDFVKHTRSPLSQAVLDESELRQLALPFSVVAERRDFTILKDSVSTNIPHFSLS